MFSKGCCFKAMIKMELCGKWSTLYHTMTNFEPPKAKSLWKSLWEKENMLVYQHFLLVLQCFQPCQIIFHHFHHIWFVIMEKLSIHTCQSFVNPFPNKPWFSRVCSTSLLKTLWEKEKLLVKSNFTFFHSVFYPSEKLSSSFINSEIVICKLFQFERV